ncbi:ATP-grasp domain-containing protein [Clostridium tepidiprofundi]|uniref:ATP-grasp domain-containing protein n=1 Tax=Clostridium tepidiprofundi TaxID=420412 RepID=UPI00082C6095|nr:ATP-grasp domain-containing protein [Clostridium tepidiprofundi]
MKNVISIGAGNEQVPSIREAKNLGLRVIALDRNKDAEGFKIADVGEVVDIKNKNEVVNIAKKYNIKAVIPAPIGRYLTTVGAVNDAMGLVGISELAADTCVDKVKFNKSLVRANKKCARQIVAAGYRQVLVAVRKIGIPCILKPRYGSGSRGVVVIRCVEEIEKKIKEHLDNCLNEDSLIEELIEGKEFGVDGVVIDGKFTLVLVREKLLTELPYRQEIGYIAPARIDNDMLNDIRKGLEVCCKILGINNCMVNADILVTHGNEIIPIELSGRPAGLLNSNYIIPCATGINFLRNGIKMHLKEENSFQAEFLKPIFLRFLDISEGEVIDIPNRNMLSYRKNILKYECNIKSGDILNKVTCGKDVYARGFIITTGKTIEQAIAEVDRILGMFKILKK